MGNVKSLYSKNEYLYWYIEKGSHDDITRQISKYPEIVNQPMTKDTKSLPLGRAAWRGDITTVKILLNHGADVNQISERGETAIIIAAKRGRLEIIKLLVEKGGDVNIVGDQGLRAIDLAILGGYYDIAYYLYPILENKQLKTPAEYQLISDKYHYRYVNFVMFIQNLQAKVHPDNAENFLKKEKKTYVDPVVDPRETWKQWFKRVGDFKPAPLVERSELPEELQPQNRVLGKMHNYIQRYASQGSKIRPNVHPTGTKSEMGDPADLSESQIINRKKMEEVQSQL